MKTYVAAAILLAAACGSESKTEAPKKAAPATDGATDDGDEETTTKTGGKLVTLTWDAYDDSKVESFKIYAAASEDEDGELVKSIKVTDDAFDSTEPSVVLDSGKDSLDAYLGKQACFAVSAVVSGKESTRSSVSCAKL